jgi:LmbE family N-acetylglucosaminyl deacetylase
MIIVFAPHQDDETIGTGGKILRAVSEKVKVKIVYLTTQEKYRQEEAEKAMEYAGLNKEDLIFLGYKNLDDKKILDDALKKIIKILKEKKPTEVYVSAYEGGHMDHDLANYLVNKAVKQTNLPITIWEYPLYNNYPGYFPIKFLRRYTTKLLPFRLGIFPPLFIPNRNKKYVLRMKKHDIRTKKAMLRIYRSQNKNDYLVKNFLYKDRFRTCPNYDYNKAPHSTLPLNYSLTRGQSFREFKEAISI